MPESCHRRRRRGRAKAALPNLPIEQIVELACTVDAVVAGPGMFESPACEAMAAALLGTDTALALDAGILRALPPHDDKARRAKGCPVLLPHAGEMAALLECEEAEVEADPDWVGPGLRPALRCGDAGQRPDQPRRPPRRPHLDPSGRSPGPWRVGQRRHARRDRRRPARARRRSAHRFAVGRQTARGGGRRSCPARSGRSASLPAKFRAKSRPCSRADQRAGA